MKTWRGDRHLKPKQQKNLINREKYKEIKKYDHRQMEEFFLAVYDRAFMHGVERAMSDVEALIRSLESGECKGVRSSTAKNVRRFAIERGLIASPDRR